MWKIYRLDYNNKKEIEGFFMKNCNGEACDREYIEDCFCANSCEKFGTLNFCQCETDSIYPIRSETSCDGYFPI